MKTTVSTVAVLALVATMSSAARADERHFDRTLDVSPGGRLTVDADGADVTVTGGEGQQVVVHVTATGSTSSLENLTFSADKSADGVTVIAKRKGYLGGMLRFSTGELTVVVTVPKPYGADVHTSGGNLVFGQLQGDVTGKTSGGDVRVDNVQGPVNMSTSGGDVRLEQIQGRVEAKSSGGDMSARNVRGDIDIATSGGTVRAEQITGASKLRSSGGDIVVQQASGPMVARTTGGDVKLEQMDGAVQASTSGGRVTVELLGTNRGIDVSTSGSDIVLVLPAAVTATLDASTGSGRVKSDLPITGKLEGNSGAHGTINGGGAPIRAKTSGGDISLKTGR